MHNEGPYVCLGIAAVGGGKRRKKKTKTVGKMTDWGAANSKLLQPRSYIITKLGYSGNGPRSQPISAGTGSKLQEKTHLIKIYCPSDRLVPTVHMGGFLPITTWTALLKRELWCLWWGKKGWSNTKEWDRRSQPCAIFSGLVFCWSPSWTDSVQSLTYVRASTHPGTETHSFTQQQELQSAQITMYNFIFVHLLTKQNGNFSKKDQ